MTEQESELSEVFISGGDDETHSLSPPSLPRVSEVLQAPAQLLPFPRAGVLALTSRLRKPRVSRTRPGEP